MCSARIVWTAAVTAVLVLGGCGGKAAGPSEVPSDPAAEAAITEERGPLADEAVAGVSDPKLAGLLADHWDWTMQTNPIWATTLGDGRFDDQLSVRDAAYVAAERAARTEFLDRARSIEQDRRDELGEDDAVTLALFIESHAAAAEREVCESHQWSISPRSNPVTRFGSLPDRHKLDRPEDGDNLLARYQQIPAAIDADIDNLRRGMSAGLVVNAESLRRTIELVDGVLAEPAEEWTLARPAGQERQGWPEERARAFATAIENAVRDEIRPAVVRYRELLQTELLPEARGADAEGLFGLSNGEACYQALIRAYTAQPELGAETLHELGKAEVARINEEMRELGQRLFGTSDLSEITARLREDDELYFDTEEAIVTKAEQATDRAREAISTVFGILPQAELVVVPIPAYEAPYTTIAYYRSPHADGSKPGEYFVNTYKPETRPRFEAEVLAYHEGIPGHHLQIAIAQERAELPAFRRHISHTAFVEGWALYTERLSDEMGLYTGDLDRMGMLSYDAWRANRLVVDTGLHALGWTREEAEDYMRTHTALTFDNIRNEVDRYITMPGQALAYKVGQLEIFRLRELARETLGDAFSLADFHDQVLRRGATTMPVLADHIHAWLDRESMQDE